MERGFEKLLVFTFLFFFAVNGYGQFCTPNTNPDSQCQTAQYFDMVEGDAPTLLPYPLHAFLRYSDGKLYLTDDTGNDSAVGMGVYVSKGSPGELAVNYVNDMNNMLHLDAIQIHDGANNNPFYFFLDIGATADPEPDYGVGTYHRIEVTANFKPGEIAEKFAEQISTFAEFSAAQEATETISTTNAFVGVVSPIQSHGTGSPTVAVINPGVDAEAGNPISSSIALFRNEEGDELFNTDYTIPDKHSGGGKILQSDSNGNLNWINSGYNTEDGQIFSDGQSITIPPNVRYTTLPVQGIAEGVVLQDTPFGTSTAFADGTRIILKVPQDAQYGFKMPIKSIDYGVIADGLGATKTFQNQFLEGLDSPALVDNDEEIVSVQSNSKGIAWARDDFTYGCYAQFFYMNPDTNRFEDRGSSSVDDNCAMSLDEKYLILSGHNKQDNAYVRTYIWNDDTGSYGIKSNTYSPLSGVDGFGIALDTSENDVLVVGANLIQEHTQTTNTAFKFGKVYVYRTVDDGYNWNLEATLESFDPDFTDKDYEFGINVSITPDGQTIFVSDKNSDVYTFTYDATNTQWVEGQFFDTRGGYLLLDSNNDFMFTGSFSPYVYKKQPDGTFLYDNYSLNIGNDAPYGFCFPPGDKYEWIDSAQARSTSLSGNSIFMGDNYLEDYNNSIRWGGVWRYEYNSGNDKWELQNCWTTYHFWGHEDYSSYSKYYDENNPMTTDASFRVGVSSAGYWASDDNYWIGSAEQSTASSNDYRSRTINSIIKGSFTNYIDFEPGAIVTFVYDGNEKRFNVESGLTLDHKLKLSESYKNAAESGYDVLNSIPYFDGASNKLLRSKVFLSGASGQSHLGGLTGINSRDVNADNVSAKYYKVLSSDRLYGVTLEVPYNMSTNYNIQLPADKPTANQILESDANGYLSWIDTPSSGGDVIGPASTTDNSVAFFTDTTGKNISDTVQDVEGLDYKLSMANFGRLQLYPVTDPTGQSAFQVLGNWDGVKFFNQVKLRAANDGSSIALQHGNVEAMRMSVSTGGAYINIGIWDENAKNYIRFTGNGTTVDLIKSQDAGAETYEITLPNKGPDNANQILEADASGNLSWINTPAPAVLSVGEMNALDVDWSANDVFTKDIISNSAITFSNLINGKEIRIKLENTSGQNRVIMWPAGIRWENNTPLNPVKHSQAAIVKLLNINGTIFGSYMEGFLAP
jgi:hypothetical protein